MKNLLVGLFLVISSSSVFACDINGESGFMEENDLWISANQKAGNGMTEKLFNEIIDKVENIYSPIIQNKGATLTVSRNWTSGTVNAYASRSGSTWNVAMFGGLARHNTVTPDGFALVVCHELGHHLGGAPRKGTRWASNEGQSDYFATSKCFRRYVEGDDNVNLMKKVKVSATVTQKCQSMFKAKEDIAICQRGAIAGLSLARLLNSLGRSSTPVDFDTPDTRVVTRTNPNHPAAQCRLDTYYSGAACTVHYSEEPDQNDPNIGYCNRDQGDVDGIRPLCWFKPL